MKSIKKLMLMFIPVIILTGCGGNAIDKGINKSLKTKSYDELVELRVNTGEQEKKYDINIVNNKNTSLTTLDYTNEYGKIRYEQYLDRKNETMYIKPIVLESFNNKEETNMGSTDEDNNEDAYIKLTTKYIFDLKTIKEMVAKPKSITKENGYYTVKVDANKVLESLNNKIYATYYLFDLYLDDRKANDVEFKVYIHNGYVKKIEADLTDLFKQATYVNDEYSEIKSFSFVIECDNYNKAKNVTINDEVKKTIIDEDKNEASIKAYLYISHINTLELKDGEYNKAEEYNHIKPENVKFNIKNKSVTSGTISIDGYKLTYKDGQVK